MNAVKRLFLLIGLGGMTHLLLSMEKIQSLPYNGNFKNIKEPKDATVFRDLFIVFSAQGENAEELRAVGCSPNVIPIPFLLATVSGDAEENNLVSVDGNKNTVSQVRLTSELLKEAALCMRFLKRSEMIQLLPDTKIRKHKNGQNINPRLWIPGSSWADMPGYVLRYGTELQSTLNDYAQEIGVIRRLEYTDQKDRNFK